MTPDAGPAAWSIAELARRSGVTARTLRHYDAIGLLTPAFTDGNGWRHYRQAELLRLQRILLLRRLGLPLPAIAAVLADGADARTALLQHRERLRAERDRLDVLLDTVTATIDTLDRGGALTPDAAFHGFDDPYEDEARARWGDAAVDAAQDRMRRWSPADAELARTGYATVHDRLRALRERDTPVDDPQVQAVVALHHRVTCRFWTPDAAAYRGLGEMYVADERFRQTIGKDLVDYLREAMVVYADTRLP